MRLNYRFLLSMLGLLATTALVVWGVHTYQSQRSSRLILERARASVAAQEASEATRLYAQYVLLNPSSAEAISEYGQLLSNLGQVEKAFFQLDASLRLNANNVAARRLLVKNALQLGRFADAKQQLSGILLKEAPNDAELLAMLAACEINLGDYEAARQHLQNALAVDKTNAEYASTLTELLTERFADAGAATVVVDNLVKNAPQEPQSYLVRSRWKLEQSQKTSEEKVQRQFQEQAKSDAARALELAPQNANCVLLAIDVEIARGDLEKAQALADEAISEGIVTPQLFGSAAQIELAKQKTDGAIARLRQGLKAFPGQIDLCWNLANLEIDSKNYAIAQTLIDELRSKNFPGAPLRFLEARILVGQGNWREAAAAIEQQRSQLERTQELLKQADFLLSICYSNMGDTDKALVSIQRAVSVAPLWIEARDSLANIYLQSGRLRDAVAEYRTIVARPNPPVGAVINLARLTFLELANSGSKQIDWTPLEDVLHQLESIDAATNDRIILQAELLVAKGESAQAESLMRKRIEDDPNAEQVWYALIALQVREQRWDEAGKSLVDAEKSLSDSPSRRLARGRFLIRRDNKDVDYAELDRLATAPGDWSDENRMNLAAGFAGYFLSLSDFDRCEKYCRLVAGTGSGSFNLPVHLLLFDLALESRNSTSIAESLDAVKRIEGQGPLWRVGEAVRLALDAEAFAKDSDEQVKRIAAAFEHLAEAAIQRPAWSRVPKIQGEINDRLGNRSAAVQSYLRAIELGELNPQIVSRAIFLLFEEGRFVEADGIVRHLQEQQSPFSSELTRVASEVSLQLENFDRALSLAEQWAEQSGKQEDHIWLAQVYGITHDYEHAEKEFHLAIDMDRSKSAPWVSYVQMLARKGDVDRATEQIGEAKKAIVPAERANALAQCYESLNDFKQAEIAYLQALKEQPRDWALVRRVADFYLKDQQVSKAQTLLNRLVSAENISDLDAAWGRRNLAFVLSLQPDESNYIKAQALIQKNLEEHGNSEADLRAMAVVLGVRPARASNERAIKILEDLSKKESRYNLVDNFLLAKLYSSVKDWTKYSRTMRSLLGNGGASNSEYVRHYAESLVEHGEIPEAQLWFKVLKELEPSEASTAQLEAQLCYRSGDFPRLIKMLKTYSDQPANVNWVAQYAESFGNNLNRSESEEFSKQLLALARTAYELDAKANSDHKHAVAAFEARQGNVQAIATILQTQALNVDQLTTILQGALASGSLTADQSKKLADHSIKTFASNPSAADLGLVIADLYSWGGSIEESIRVYGQVLAVQPNSVEALNNVAMAMAASASRKQEASIVIEKAISIVGKADYLLDTRAVVRLALGQASLAEEDLNEAIHQSPRADRYFHLAQVLLTLNRKADAEIAYQRAVEGGISAASLHPLERGAFDQLRKQLKGS